MSSKKNTKALLIGGSGFVGRLLGTFLHAEGYDLQVLSRQANLPLPYPAEVFCWQRDGSIPAAALAEADVVINLAGASIATGRWSQVRKREIVASRVESTQALVTALSPLAHKPLVVQATGIGYYGDRGDEPLTEDATAGTGFLADTARQWEAVLQTAQLTNRYVLMRLGLVLGEGGGALPVLRRIYRWGGGASLGSGQQYVSWVHGEDVCRFVLHVLHHDTCHGIYNLTAPSAITYDTWHRALMHRYQPLVASPVRVPVWLLHLLLGEKAELMTASQRAVPQRTLATGYVFQFTDINTALASIKD